MIDDKQVRAARALLDWSQDTLAKKAGVARATIKNIENGTTLPRMESAHAIRSTLECAGIEFLSGSGVRMRDNMIQTFEGKTAGHSLLDDIYETLRDTGGEILIAFLDEGRGIQELGEEFLAEHGEKRRKANITHRLLIHPDEKYIIAALEKYRILPPEYFSPNPLFVYGSKLALLSTEPTGRAVILNDERFALSATLLFNFIWDRTEMPSCKDRISQRLL